MRENTSFYFSFHPKKIFLLKPTQGKYCCRPQILSHLARPNYQILSTKTEEKGTTQLPSPRLSEGCRKVDQGTGTWKNVSHPNYTPVTTTLRAAAPP